MQQLSDCLPRLAVWDRLPTSGTRSHLMLMLSSFKVVEMTAMKRFLKKHGLWYGANSHLKADLCKGIFQGVYEVDPSAGTRPSPTPPPPPIRGQVTRPGVVTSARRSPAVASPSSITADYLARLQARSDLAQSLFAGSKRPITTTAVNSGAPLPAKGLPGSRAHASANVKKRKMNLGPRCSEVSLSSARYPFHKLLAVVHVAEWNRNARPPYSCVFTLTPSELDLLKSRDNVELVVRLFDWRKKQDVGWGGAGASLRSGLGKETTPVVKRRRKKDAAFFAEPLVLRKPNSVQVKLSLSAYSHMLPSLAMVIEQVQVLTCAELAASVANIADDTLRKSADDGVEETSFKVALRCPLGFVRIEQPAKGRLCKHAQCFDLETYLQFGQKQLEWFCPICSKPLPVPDLRKSKLFSDILAFAGGCDDDDLVEIDLETMGMKLCSTLSTGDSGDGPAPSQGGSQIAGTQPSVSSQPSQSTQTSSISSSAGAIVLLSDDEDSCSALAVDPAPSNGAGRVDQRTPKVSSLQPFVEEDFDYFLDWAVVTGGQDSQPSTAPSQARPPTDVIVISD